MAFYLQVQGQASISVDGRRVAMGRNGTESRKVYTLDAKAGQDYEIQINYACRRGEASLSFDLGYEEEVSIDKTVAACADADVVIFAGGISPSLEGEEMPVSIEGFRGGDRTKIELPAAQTELVKALAAAGRKVVFVNYSGSAMGLKEVEPSCAAILQAWYPGEEGGNAVASVLYGSYNPGGRLPVTFYASTDQLPDFEDYSMKGRTYRYMTEKPLYAFGYGLSYSKFAYKGVKIRKSGDNYTVSLKLKNKGKMDGDEVVQVYLRRPGDAEGPSHALRAFKRVNVPAGKTVKVEIELTPEQLEWFDPNINLMNNLPGKYEVLVGASSDPDSLKVLKVTL